MARAPVATVFGGTGFLGQFIVRRLLQGGWLVRIAARHPQAVKAQASDDRLDYCTVDVRDEAAIRAALQGAAAAINAVGLYVEQGEQTFHNIHVAGAERIAHLAAAAGVPALVHVSGLGVSTESKSAYVRARAEGEQAARAAFADAIVVRPSVLFGPEDAFLTALENVTKLPLIPLFGNGATKLQPVHVADVAAAIEQALALRCSGIYELGGARICSYREVVQAMLVRTGRRRLLLPVPFPVWRLLAAALSLLPNPPLTSDQVILMQRDNIVGDEGATFADLYIKPRSLETALPALGRES